MSQGLEKLMVFSDGACSGNPGPGGWGAVVVFTNGDVQELGGADPSTTNNRMEISGVMNALDFLSDTPGDVAIHTDSTYVIRGITQWVFGWRKRGWKTAEGKEVLNKDLWERLASQVQKRKTMGAIEWNYTRGHNGTPGNERCDEIAVAFSKRTKIKLYQGPLIKYDVDIMMVTPEPLPEMKQAGAAKVAAHSYLSNIGGIVYRHKDWPSCDRRVKGKSGAKFKKSKSAADELEILKAWGLSPGTTIKSE